MESPSIIKEDLLHYVWKTRQFDLSDLQLVDGRKLEILNFGHQNEDAGPDFSEATIIIDGIKWIGNVEMHTISSMWKRHNHHLDSAYDNVILHVVYEDDCPVIRKDGSIIPTLTLRDRINDSIHNNYSRLISSEGWVPCESMIHQVDSSRVSLWLNQTGISRLERKTGEINALLNQYNNDWEQICFILLCKYMGAKVNTLPMELMARQCDVKILSKNRDHLSGIEAILFGLSGMLQSPYKGEYPQKLITEFKFFQKKYNLNPINPVAWKFSRMRPSNFPTIRIAQIADMMTRSPFIFRRFIEAESIKEVVSLLNARASNYWDNHYRFDVESNIKKKQLSKSWIEMLIINVVAPLLFIYGKSTFNLDLCDKAISFMEDLPAEKNAIINKWQSLGVEVKNALQSQGSLQLKQEYCSSHQCLSCSIGNQLIKGNRK